MVPFSRGGRRGRRYGRRRLKDEEQMKEQGQGQEQRYGRRRLEDHEQVKE
jgi:hypothetical protein